MLQYTSPYIYLRTIYIFKKIKCKCLCMQWIKRKEIEWLVILYSPRLAPTSSIRWNWHSIRRLYQICKSRNSFKRNDTALQGFIYVYSNFNKEYNESEREMNRLNVNYPSLYEDVIPPLASFSSTLQAFLLEAHSMLMSSRCRLFSIVKW